MRIAAIVLVMLGLLPGPVNLAAQQRAGAPLAFDVVSVRAAEGATLTGRGIQIVPGRFRAVDMPLMSLILRAYDVAHWRVEGAEAIRPLVIHRLNARRRRRARAWRSAIPRAPAGRRK